MGKSKKIKKKTQNPVEDLVLKDLAQQISKLERQLAFLKKESESNNIYKNANNISSEIDEIITRFNVLLVKEVKIDPRNIEDMLRLFELILAYFQNIHAFKENIEQQGLEQGGRLLIKVINLFVRTIFIMRAIEKAPVANRPDQHININTLTHATILFVKMSNDGHGGFDERGITFINQLLEEMPNRIKHENEPSRSIFKSAFQAQRALLEVRKPDFDLQRVNQLMQLSEKSYKNTLKQVKQCPTQTQMLYILGLIPTYYLAIANELSDKNLFDEAVLWMQDTIAMTKFVRENKGNLSTFSKSKMDLSILQLTNQLNRLIEHSHKFKLSLILKQLLKEGKPFNILQGGECLRIGFEKEYFDELAKILTMHKYKFDTFVDNPEYVEKNPTLGKYVIELNLSRYSTTTLESIFRLLKQRLDNKAENPKKLALLDRLTAESIENSISTDKDGNVSLFVNLTPVNCQILENILLSHQCLYDVSKPTTDDPGSADEVYHTLLFGIDDVSLSAFEDIINEFLTAIQKQNAASIDALSTTPEKDESEQPLIVEVQENSNIATNQIVETISESSTANIQQALVEKQKPLSAEKLAQLARHQASVAEKARERERQAQQLQARAVNQHPTIRREVRWDDPKFANVTNKNLNLEYMEIHRRKKTFLLFAPGIFDDGHLEDRARNVASIGKYLTSKLSKGRQGVVKYGNSKTQAKNVKRQAGYDWKIKLQGLDERPLGYTATFGYYYENGVKKENEKVELIYIDKVIKSAHK